MKKAKFSVFGIQPIQMRIILGIQENRRTRQPLAASFRFAQLNWGMLFALLPLCRFLLEQIMSELESLEGTVRIHLLTPRKQDAHWNIKGCKRYLQFRERVCVQSQEGALVAAFLEDVQHIPVRMVFQPLEVVDVFTGGGVRLDAQAGKLTRELEGDVRGLFLELATQIVVIICAQLKGVDAGVVAGDCRKFGQPHEFSPTEFGEVLLDHFLPFE